MLGLFAHNIEKTPIATLMRPVITVVAVALVLWCICWALTRNRYKGGVMASALVLAALPGWSVLENSIAVAVPIVGEWGDFVFYTLYIALTAAVGAALYRWGPQRLRSWRWLAGLAGLAVVIAATVEGLMAPAFGRGASWCIAAYLVVVIGVVIYLALRRSGFILMTRTANWFAAILIGLSVANIAYNWQGAESINPTPLAALDEAVANANNKPDIYLIVLDGYPRHDMLRDVYAYNNLPFLNNLRGLGLTMPGNSMANYPEPILALASLLNMDYVHRAAGEEADEVTLAHAVELYHNNRAFAALAENGYDIIVFPPGLTLLEPRLNVEVNRPADILNEFEMVLAGRTAASRMLQAWNYIIHRDNLNLREVVERRRVFHVFDGLAELAAAPSERPRMVYAYLSIPGPPFLFSRDSGRAEPSSVVTQDTRDLLSGAWSDYVQAYVDQLTFTNRRLEQTVTRILEAADEPPVILITSCHGVGVYRNELRWAPPEMLMSNLTLLSLPGQEDAGLDTNAVSLVNLLRVAFNQVFDADLPMLEDELVWPQAEETPPPVDSAARP